MIDTNANARSSTPDAVAADSAARISILLPDLRGGGVERVSLISGPSSSHATTMLTSSPCAVPGKLLELLPTRARIVELKERRLRLEKMQDAGPVPSLQHFAELEAS